MDICGHLSLVTDVSAQVERVLRAHFLSMSRRDREERRCLLSSDLDISLSSAMESGGDLSIDSARSSSGSPRTSDVAVGMEEADF